MTLPIIDTNIWDALYGVPLVIVVTQIVKMLLKVPDAGVPFLALLVALFFSVFISHRHDLPAGLFMGFFYGLSAIGNYAAIKSTFRWYQRRPYRRRWKH